MEILIVGNPAHLQECREKFIGSDLVHARSHDEAESLLEASHVVFDFIIDKRPEALRIYAPRKLTVFLNTCMTSITELTRHHSGLQCTPIGFNGLPTLFNRECLEVAVLDPRHIPELERICKELQTEFLLVDDRVGLVTPRVVCMIINEAFYTVEEGTATREDIDLAMKLGTNYPYGPFEWCDRIGLDNVYLLLQALFEDTKDQRYKIAPLMKKEFMRHLSGRA